MITPSHDEISKRAFQLWHEHGSPAGHETETWLIAERQLTAKAAETTAALATLAVHEAQHETRAAAQLERTVTATAAKSMADEHPLSPAVPDQKALNVAQQKHDARAPQIPHHTGPHTKPPESGKPVWNQPHSS